LFIAVVQLLPRFSGQSTGWGNRSLDLLLAPNQTTIDHGPGDENPNFCTLKTPDLLNLWQE